MKPKYGLVTYATDAKTLIRVSEAESSDAVWVTEKLNKISYEGQKSEGNGGKFIFEVTGFRGVVSPAGGAGRTIV